jgi:hypothetical protein
VAGTAQDPVATAASNNPMLGEPHTANTTAYLIDTLMKPPAS